jgi:DNA-binding NtrC family response regulator
MVLHESNEPIALPLQLQTPPSLDEQEKQIILAALQKYGGHRIQTATALGMGVRTLGMKLRAWGMSRVPVAPEAH